MFEVNNKDTRTSSMKSFLFLLLTLKIFYIFFSVFIVGFEQVMLDGELLISFV